MNTHEILPGPEFQGREYRIPANYPAKDSPWNTALWLRYVHNHAKRDMFRYRHGPALDGPNTFEIVEFS